MVTKRVGSSVQQDLLESVREGAGALAGHIAAAAKNGVWPARGPGNDLPERNLCFHVATALEHRGYCAYFEFDHGKRNAQRIDLVAIRWTKPARAVCCEFKLLYQKADAADAMAYDVVEKLKKFVVRRESGEVLPLQTARAVLGSSWKWPSKFDVGAWWASDLKSSKPRWSKLAAALQGTTRKVHSFKHFDSAHQQTQQIVVAVW